MSNNQNNSKEIIELINSLIEKWEKERDGGRGYINDRIKSIIDKEFLRDLRKIRRKLKNLN